MIGEGHLIKAFDLRAETVEIFLLTASGECRKRPAMERAFKGNRSIALRVTGGGVVFTRHLDRAFKRLGAGIREEDRVGEGVLNQPTGEPLAIGDLIEIRRVPKFLGLRLKRRHEMRVSVANGINRDARAEIEIALACGRNQPSALASLKRKVHSREYRQKRR